MLGSPGRGVDNSLKSSHSMLGITMHGLHGREKSSLLCIYSNPQTDELYNLLPPPQVVQVWMCLTAWQRWVTSAKIGRYVLKLIYLTDSLSPGEVKHQDPVAWGDVLQPAM